MRVGGDQDERGGGGVGGARHRRGHAYLSAGPGSARRRPGGVSQGFRLRHHYVTWDGTDAGMAAPPRRRLEALFLSEAVQRPSKTEPVARLLISGSPVWRMRRRVAWPALVAGRPGLPDPVAVPHTKRGWASAFRHADLAPPAPAGDKRYHCEPPRWPG